LNVLEGFEMGENTAGLTKGVPDADGRVGVGGGWKTLLLQLVVLVVGASNNEGCRTKLAAARS
jgi:hypothetical protein